MKKTNVVIIDDEIAAAENIKILLETYCPEVQVLGMEHSIVKGFQLIKKTNPRLGFFRYFYAT